MTSGVVGDSGAVRQRAPWLNTKILIAAVVLVAAVAFLIYNSMQGTAAAYFVTVSELQQQGEAVDGTRVRVGGDVVAGTIQMGGPGQPIHFMVEDPDTGATMEVVYSEVVPDIFSDHVQVIVEGTYHHNGTFEADTLLTKCPSRFEASPPAA